jgi:hypothetical protein
MSKQEPNEECQSIGTKIVNVKSRTKWSMSKPIPNEQSNDKNEQYQTLNKINIISEQKQNGHCQSKNRMSIAIVKAKSK